MVLAVALGIALRLSHPADIEWKGDERWLFLQAQLMAASGSWPGLGLTTSIGSPSPGMNVWVFAGLFEVFGVETPPDFARAVQSLNGTALVAFMAFSLAVVPKERRERDRAGKCFRLAGRSERDVRPQV
jgi:hypothetical protein